MNKYNIKNEIVNVTDYNKLKDTIIRIKKERKEKIQINFNNLNTVIIKTWFLKILNEHILTKIQLNRLLSKRIISNAKDVK